MAGAPFCVEGLVVSLLTVMQRQPWLLGRIKNGKWEDGPEVKAWVEGIGGPIAYQPDPEPEPEPEGERAAPEPEEAFWPVGGWRH